MASNSKSTTLYPQSGYGYTLYCSFSEQKLTDDQTSRNVTRIDAYGLLQANGTYWSTSYWSSIVLYWHDNKENKDIEIARNDFTGLSGTYDKRECSASFDIAHKDDGTLSGYVWLKFNKGSTTSVHAPAGDGSVGTDWTALTTIPRATALANQSGIIGQTLTINWTKASKDFTHKLTYSFGTIVDEVLGTDLADGYTWQIPEKLYQQFTDNDNGKGKLKLTTYNGSTQIGSTKEAELTIYANQNDAEPIVEDISLKDINSATIALTGDNTMFVLNQSRIFLTFSFETRKFATVRSLTVNGQSINVDELNTGQQTQDGSMSYGLQYEYGTLTSNTIVFTITDSRGFQVIHTMTIHDSVLINYVSLSAVVDFKRVAPTTGEVGLEFNGNYFNGSFGEESNDLTIYYRYKKSNETEYSVELPLTKDTDYKISGNTYYSGLGTSKQQIVLAPTFDYKSQYDLQLTIKDKLTTLPVINVIITKGIPIFWWNGEKVTINGDLYLADEDGNNPVNIKDKLDVIVDNLDDNATDKAPSQRAVNEALLDVYSTEEKIIGKWADGSDLYRKTFIIPNDSTLTQISVQHNIQNLNEVTDVRGSVKTYTSWKPITNTYVPDVAEYSVSIYNIHPTNGTFQILVGATLAREQAFKKANITLEYTKTTD